MDEKSKNLHSVVTKPEFKSGLSVAMIIFGLIIMLFVIDMKDTSRTIYRDTRTTELGEFGSTFKPGGVAVAIDSANDGVAAGLGIISGLLILSGTILLSKID